MDAFFASVEQLDAPELRGKPVVVGGSPDGRGVVAAASYEARKYGIRSAMPARRAVKLCPHLIFVKSRFERYKEISAQIREIFYSFTDLVEPLSLDEAYLDITENKRGIASARQLARLIKEEIKAKTGLTASAGVAVNKFVAKIASDLNKPDGLAVITPEKMIPFLEQLPVGKFHGVGKATEAKMHGLHLFTGADLKKLSEPELLRHFGKVGHFYYNIVRGIDDRPVKPNRIRKSVGAENTFSEDLQTLPEMKARLSVIAAKLAERMQRAGAMGKTITLKVRYEDFESVTRSRTLDHLTDREDELFQVALSLLDQTRAGIRPVRLLGISVSNLNLQDEEDHVPGTGSMQRPGIQLELFEQGTADD
ncbi:DNA polymerase-4 [Cyclonatronum proteinivorum]|uniref:DNA polymerase IV n=1 Tax=Cyclonatronum proteinivorum TaxID=1457365 RepID=A0A345UHV9_9BACT|nr:DNA polymerase-4 [Cyclonatronum proteinivorum]